MKITINIPETLYGKAEDQATVQGVKPREIVLAALEKDIDPAARHAGRADDEPHFDIDDLGLQRLRRAKDDPAVVTEAFLNPLREQEGI